MEKCKTYQNKVEKVKRKNKIWMNEMSKWYDQFRNHKDFSKDHPEVKKYSEVKLKVDKKINRLKTKHLYYAELLKNFQ